MAAGEEKRSSGIPEKNVPEKDVSRTEERVPSTILPLLLPCFSPLSPPFSLPQPPPPPRLFPLSLLY